MAEQAAAGPARREDRSGGVGRRVTGYRPGVTEDEWLRDYALLILRLDRDPALSGAGVGWCVDYFGPAEWREQVAGEPRMSAGRLVAEAERLAAELPFDGRRRVFLAALVRALNALARHAAGGIGARELMRECLGVDPEPVPEAELARAHEDLDRALPRTPGSLAARLRDWRVAHTLPGERLGEVPELVAAAVAECRRRCHRIVPLPDGERVGCEIVPGAAYVGMGAHHGGLDSTILLGGARPFVLADLLYVVGHEGHPGHIAEQVLKEIHLGDRVEQRVRFAPAPPYVLSEGLALHAQAVLFPGDEAQAWLADRVLAPRGIRPDGSDFAAIHRARNVLFGARHNAALLAAEGRPAAGIVDYLTRWGLVEDPDPRTLGPYGSAYYHGWRLLDDRLDDGLVRRLLTEQVLPADLGA